MHRNPPAYGVWRTTILTNGRTLPTSTFFTTSGLSEHAQNSQLPRHVVDASLRMRSRPQVVYACGSTRTLSWEGPGRTGAGRRGRCFCQHVRTPSLFKDTLFTNWPIFHTVFFNLSSHRPYIPEEVLNGPKKASLWTWHWRHIRIILMWRQWDLARSHNGPKKLRMDQEGGNRRWFQTLFQIYMILISSGTGVRVWIWTLSPTGCNPTDLLWGAHPPLLRNICFFLASWTFFFWNCDSYFQKFVVEKVFTPISQKPLFASLISLRKNLLEKSHRLPVDGLARVTNKFRPVIHNPSRVTFNTLDAYNNTLWRNLFQSGWQQPWPSSVRSCVEIPVRIKIFGFLRLLRIPMVIHPDKLFFADEIGQGRRLFSTKRPVKI